MMPVAKSFDPVSKYLYTTWSLAIGCDAQGQNHLVPMDRTFTCPTKFGKAVMVVAKTLLKGALNKAI
jgi:hypothetical protein